MREEVISAGPYLFYCSRWSAMLSITQACQATLFQQVAKHFILTRQCPSATVDSPARVIMLRQSALLPRPCLTGESLNHCHLISSLRANSYLRNGQSWPSGDCQQIATSFWTQGGANNKGTIHQRSMGGVCDISLCNQDWLWVDGKTNRCGMFGFFDVKTCQSGSGRVKLLHVSINHRWVTPTVEHGVSIAGLAK